MNECRICQASLSGAELTLAWEDGNNPNGYVTCRCCCYENTAYGFGQDD